MKRQGATSAPRCGEEPCPCHLSCRTDPGSSQRPPDSPRCSARPMRWRHTTSHVGKCCTVLYLVQDTILLQPVTTCHQQVLYTPWPANRPKFGQGLPAGPNYTRFCQQDQGLLAGPNYTRFCQQDQDLLAGLNYTRAYQQVQ